jgi:hypothetical protein
LLGCRGEPFVQRPDTLHRERSIQLFTLLAEHPVWLLTRCAAAEILRGQGADHGEGTCDDHRDGLSVHKRNLKIFR